MTSPSNGINICVTMHLSTLRITHVYKETTMKLTSYLLDTPNSITRV